jgi:phosphotransferase system IIA component
MLLVHIGARTVDLIAEAGCNGVQSTAEDISRMSHAQLLLRKLIKEAALAATDSITRVVIHCCTE